MAEKTLSRELRICCAIWRKVHQERDKPDPIVINAANLNAAISLRQAMYRAAKPFREGKLFDEDIRLAADNFVVTLDKAEDPHKPHRLIIRPRTTLSDLEAQLEDLGIDESDLQLASEKGAVAKLSEFLDKSVPEPSTVKRNTPFYTRD